MGVKLYMTPTCPWCKKTKELFTSRDVDFDEYDVTSDKEAAEEMVKESGQRGVPVSVIGNKVIVGFDKEALEQALEAA